MLGLFHKTYGNFKRNDSEESEENSEIFCSVIEIGGRSVEWIHDIKGQQYEQLLKILFAHCDTVQCIVREDVGDYFEEIAYECLEKKVCNAMAVNELRSWGRTSVAIYISLSL